MAPAQIPMLLTQKPSTENGINRATTLLLAWLLVNHADNKIAGRIIPFLVIPYGTQNTVLCAGVMPYRRHFPAANRIQAFQAEQA